MKDKLLESFIKTLSEDGTETALGQALAFSIRAQAQAEAAQQPAGPATPGDATVFKLARLAASSGNIQLRLTIAEKELESALNWARDDPRLWGLKNESQKVVDALRADLKRALVAER